MTNRTQLASGEILNGIDSERLASAARRQAGVRGRHVAAATHASIPAPLFRAGGDGVPIGGKCQHRISRDQRRQTEVIMNALSSART